MGLTFTPEFMRERIFEVRPLFSTRLKSSFPTLLFPFLSIIVKVGKSHFRRNPYSCGPIANHLAQRCASPPFLLASSPPPLLDGLWYFSMPLDPPILSQPASFSPPPLFLSYKVRIGTLRSGSLLQRLFLGRSRSTPSLFPLRYRLLFFLFPFWISAPWPLRSIFRQWNSSCDCCSLFPENFPPPFF